MGLCPVALPRLRGKHRKLLERIVGGHSDASIPFDRLCALLGRLGFAERVRGSHHVFSRQDIPELLDLQETREATAKPYQVKQVRELLTKYKIPS